MSIPFAQRQDLYWHLLMLTEDSKRRMAWISNKSDIVVGDFKKWIFNLNIKQINYFIIFNMGKKKQVSSNNEES